MEEKEYYPLSSAQKRLYLLYQSDKSNTAYNMPAVFNLEGQLKKERLAEIFNQLMRRHESFRTSFAQVKGEPVQRIHREVDFEIEYYDLAAKNAKEREEGRGAPLWSPFIRPFDLSKAPLLRVGLIETGEEEHILVFDMHHIISDGVSMGILVREFMTLYAGKPLPLPQVQYKDYAQWQCSGAWQESLKAAEVFWLEQFRAPGGRPQLKLPADFDRPIVRNFAGATLEFELGNRETAALKQAAIEEETTLYMVLLALYFVLLARLSGQEDITVGTPVVGRQREELQYTIGMFVNTLALRNFPKVEYPFRNFLKEVKEKTLKALKYQDYPFEKLVEKAAPNLDNSRNPLFDVMFTLQNLDIPALHIPGLALKPYPHESVTAKFDLNLIGIEKNEALLFTLEYSSKLFKSDTIGRFSGYFKDIITAILENRDIKLGDIEMSLALSESKSALSREAEGNFEF
ncbi:MAG: condensation domain-containing protein [Candidatus Aminicenantes bacterium]|nr:condensation domain-containing protein [Candidatus Aminicenantes bacterium]